MIEKVLLLSLPAVIEKGDTYLEDGKSFHLGLAYLAAVLRDQGILVRILDAYVEAQANKRDASEEDWLELGLTDEEILDRIDHFGPDMIGISIPFSCQHYVALRLAEKIRDRFPHIILVGGGNHVSACPEVIPECIFDFLVLGEGERSLLKLVDKLNQVEDNKIARKDLPKGVYPNPQRDALFELDELPFPAIDLLPLDKLWCKGRRWINMIATRGCVYDCVFCSIHTIMGYLIRRRSVEAVIREILHWVERYQIEEIYFEDDNLTLNRQWAKDLFREIAVRNLGIRFYVRNGVRADTIDLEMLELMKSAGFHEIAIAPESGNQWVLDEVINKRMNLEDHIRVVKLARSIHMGVNVFFVLGFIEETWEDLQTTVRFAERLRSMGCKGFWFSLASPFPGTRLYNEYKEKGYLPDPIDYRRFRSVDYLIQNPHYSSEQIKTFRREVMRKFEPKHTLFHALAQGIRLAVLDPSFFLVKARYKSKRYIRA
ncbi:MAG: B12-binding domain-containing radical SAM protein [Anaerolineales bacterium]|nr:B12-binding domain-containing radical SAM protein [Anaerolineales bacterium]